MRVVMPLPDRDFDTTEVAVPWRVLSDRGHEAGSATESDGGPPACDPRLLAGVLFGRLGADPEPIEVDEQLVQAPEFQDPIPWGDIDPNAFDGLLLAGGHAPGMRQYLASTALQEKVVAYWQLERPVGAICHGVIVLARATDPATGRSVIANKRTTCLPKFMERGAFYATAWKLGRYYRTDPAYVEDEVIAGLNDARQFLRGPLNTKRGSAGDHRHAFVVQDGHYVSARWPGDAYLFAERFDELLTGAERRAPAETSPS